MELSPETVESLAGEYAKSQPLATVEEEHLETLPAALSAGEYGWRDVEWIVQWYYRRHLGSYPDAERRAGEAAFRENEFDDLRAAIAGATAADATAAKLEALTGLAGVDTSVATAFLQFLEPAAYLVMSDHEWNALRACDEFARSYPERPSAAEYERYLETCRTAADRYNCDLQTLYRALWTVEVKKGD
jgi:hypothetical protein